MVEIGSNSAIIHSPKRYILMPEHLLITQSDLIYFDGDVVAVQKNVSGPLNDTGRKLFIGKFRDQNQFSQILL